MLIGEPALTLVRGAVEAEALEPFTLKGKPLERGVRDRYGLVEAGEHREQPAARQEQGWVEASGNSRSSLRSALSAGHGPRPSA